MLDASVPRSFAIENSGWADGRICVSPEAPPFGLTIPGRPFDSCMMIDPRITGSTWKRVAAERMASLNCRKTSASPRGVSVCRLIASGPEGAAQVLPDRGGRVLDRLLPRPLRGHL